MIWNRSLLFMTILSLFLWLSDSWSGHIASYRQFFEANIWAFLILTIILLVVQFQKKTRLPINRYRRRVIGALRPAKRQISVSTNFSKQLQLVLFTFPVVCWTQSTIVCTGMTGCIQFGSIQKQTQIHCWLLEQYRASRASRASRARILELLVGFRSCR